MDQNQPVINGLPVPTTDPAQLQSAIQGMLTQVPQAGAPDLETFTQMQQRRLARITDITGALSAQLGGKAPEVVALQNLSAAVSEINTRITNGTNRVKSWPKPRPNEWLVFGSVVDAKGSPAAGLSVRVFDKDRIYDDLLGETETDESGDFSVIYHERDFKEKGENLPDLYVMVSDLSGKLLYSSRDNVRYEAGRSEYFAIRLGKGRASSARKSSSGAPASSSPASQKATSPGSAAKTQSVRKKSTKKPGRPAK